MITSIKSKELVLKRFCFPKNRRLLKNSQFQAVFAERLRFSNQLLTLYMAPNSCCYARLGVSVGKSCGGAVVRNRMKRLLREAFRQSCDQIRPEFDYVLILSPRWLKKNKAGEGTKIAARRLKCEDVKGSFLSLVAKASEQIDNEGLD